MAHVSVFFQIQNFPYGRQFYVFDDKLPRSMVENLKNETVPKRNLSSGTKIPWTTTNFNSDHMKSMLLRNPK